MTFEKPEYKDVRWIQRINPHERGIVTFGGRIVDIKEPGFKIGIPRLHQVAIVSLEPHRYKTSFSAICKSDNSKFDAGFKLDISLSTRYRIENPRNYMENAPSDLDEELETLLRGQGSEKIARDHTWKAIYNNRSILRENIENFLQSETSYWGIKTENIELTNIIFPEVISEVPEMDYETNVKGPILKAKEELQKAIAEIKAQKDANIRRITGSAELDLKAREYELNINYKTKEAEIFSNLAIQLSQSLGPEFGALVMLQYQNNLTGSSEKPDLDGNPIYDKIKTKMNLEGIGEGAKKADIEPKYALFMQALRDLEGFPIMNMSGGLSNGEFKNKFGEYK